MGLKTPLFEQHQALNARIVDFSGWDMPLHYGSQIEEHHQVRQAAGVFDVSHMTAVDIGGAPARDTLRRLFANDIDKLRTPGQALYTTMLNDSGGILDDLIVYRIAEDASPTPFRVVVNCATREKDLQWFAQQAAAGTQIQHRRDLAILAVQGPNAIAACVGLLPTDRSAVEALAPFRCVLANDWLIARTGYTGEDGLEIILPHAEAVALWQQLLARGVKPIGLGARDTLRLEGGLCLYGQDMDETTTPLESNLAWTVTWKPEARTFIGRTALEDQRRAGVKRALTGIVLVGKGVMRHGQRVDFSDGTQGEITSGIFSPTLGYSIGLARVPASHPIGECTVDIRGKAVAARLVKPPFVKHGKALV